MIAPAQMEEEANLKMTIENEKKSTVRPRGTDSAKVVRVIETKAIMGTGEDADPNRLVTQYWDFEGNLLATVDPLNGHNHLIDS